MLIYVFSFHIRPLFHSPSAHLNRFIIVAHSQLLTRTVIFKFIPAILDFYKWKRLINYVSHVFVFVRTSCQVHGTFAAVDGMR